MSKYHNLSCQSIALLIAMFLTVIYTAPLYGQEGYHEENVSIMATTEYQFQGVASGGTLIMAGTSGRNARFFSIETRAGESAESIANRLAEYIDENNPLEWGGFWTGLKSITAEGSTLSGLVGDKASYMFAGSETGLGIPEPPLSVSCSYDQNEDLILVDWINPAEGYDYICILMNWHNYDWSGGGSVPCQSTSFVIDRKKYQHPIDINELDVWVIGMKNGLPSNAGAIHMSGNGKIQEELFGIPFTNGVAPNWQAWSLNTTPNKELIKSHINETLIFAKGRRYNPIKTADAKPFKQVLKTPASGGTVGIWRKFLGLMPGHTYHLSARLNTLEMDPNDTGWSFSMHAMPDKVHVSKLTANQMAGLEALPHGQSGLQAARLAILSTGITTSGEYVEKSGDITLPQDSNSITVWLRLTSTKEAEVSFDWIKLEDITPSQ